MGTGDQAQAVSRGVGELVVHAKRNKEQQSIVVMVIDKRTRCWQPRMLALVYALDCPADMGAHPLA